MSTYNTRVLGEYIGDSGLEEKVFLCGQCGRPKLYLNAHSKLFYCFACSWKGRAEDSPIPNLPYSLSRLEWAIETYTVRNSVRLCDSQIAVQWLAYRGIYSPIPGTLEDLGVTFGEVHSECRVIIPFPLGIHGYSAVSSTRYKTFGRRGLFSLSIGSGSRVFLFEGLFDCLSTYQYAYTEGIEGRYIFSAGNSLTDLQLDQLIDYHPVKVFLCFDSDLSGPPLSLKHKLSPILPTEILSPKPYKDWDNAMQEQEGKKLFYDRFNISR